MKEKTYFVILNCQKEGDYFPLTNDIGKLLMYKSETDATVAGEANSIGNFFGFEVFEKEIDKCIANVYYLVLDIQPDADEKKKEKNNG